MEWATKRPSFRGENGNQRAEIDRGGHDKAAGVVGMLADEINAAWGLVDGRFGGVG